MIAYYLTHPQVEIDRAIPVPDWSLSPKGRERIKSVLDKPWLHAVGRIVSSNERKAVEGAELIAATLDIAVETAADMGENDRSSTGFLEPPAFENAADQFFAHPETDWNGWERALDRHEPSKPILFVGHGAVGTLLKCHLARKPIGRDSDQPAGGGNVFAFRLRDRRLLCDWTPMETFSGLDQA